VLTESPAEEKGLIPCILLCISNFLDNNEKSERLYPLYTPISSTFRDLISLKIRYYMAWKASSPNARWSFEKYSR
jgi:hypothetical protein